MQNTKRLMISLGLFGLFSISGCAVYKIDVQQGNIVSQDMVDLLQPGMTRSQARFVMGTALITDTFHPERWDYVYTLQPGGGTRLQEGQTLLFNQAEQLSGLSGDFMPGMSRSAAILGDTTPTSVAPTAAQPPAAQQPARPGSLEEQIQSEVDSAEVLQAPTPEPLDSTE
jgi:outer membrane protein assembly factor BamE